jgi:hypothetical protein
LFFGAFLPPGNQNTQPVYERSPQKTYALFSGCKHTALFPFRNGFLCLFFVFLRLFFLLRGFQYVTTKVFFRDGGLGRGPWAPAGRFGAKYIGKNPGQHLLGL